MLLREAVLETFLESFTTSGENYWDSLPALGPRGRHPVSSCPARFPCSAVCPAAPTGAGRLLGMSSVGRGLALGLVGLCQEGVLPARGTSVSQQPSLGASFFSNVNRMGPKEFPGRLHPWGRTSTAAFWGGVPRPWRSTEMPSAIRLRSLRALWAVWRGKRNAGGCLWKRGRCTHAKGRRCRLGGSFPGSPSVDKPGSQSLRPTCLRAQGLPTHHLGRVHGPVELPAEVLAVVHVDVVINVLVHHVRLKHHNSYPFLHQGVTHSPP